MFGLHWLLRKFNIYPNAYYSYLKNRKAGYHQYKSEIKNNISETYHSHGGVDGYRTVHAYITRKGYIDLYDRSVVASITDSNITADLACRTLQKAIESQPGIDLTKLLIHSDQGSKYTSKEYTEFCENLGIAKSMSKAGYPYNNAPMERYFNTLKTDLIYQHHYRTEKELYTAIEDFAYVHYNHVRPPAYNKYKTHYEARYGVK